MLFKKIKFNFIKTGFSVILILALLLVTAAFLTRPAKADSLFGLNEGYGTTVTDSVSSSNTGTITNAVWKSQENCLSGSCLYFDGAGDYVSFGDNANYDFAAATNFTIEIWFKTPVISSGTRVLISKYNATAGGYKIYMSSDGKLNFGIDDDTTWGPDDVATSQNRYDDSQWHHLTAIKTGTTDISLYIDAQRVGQDTSISATGTLVNTNNFYLGIDGNGSSNSYLGYLDELRIYTTTARSASQVKLDAIKNSGDQGTSAVFGSDLSNLNNGLVGYWKMDEATWSGTLSEVIDSSGNGNNGQAQGTTGGKAYPAGGKYGKSGYFDKADDFVSVPNSSSLDPNSAITISSWFKTTSTTAAGLVARANQNSPYQGYGLLMNPNYINCGTAGYVGLWVGDNTNGWVCTTVALNNGQWHQVVATYDGTIGKIYIDGTLNNSAIRTNGLSDPSNENLRIGSNQTGINNFNGSIDETRIYNRVLSPTEVAQLYSWAPGPMGYWKLDEGQGNKAYDSSGNNVTGTLMNTTSVLWKTGKFGTGITTGNNLSTDRIDLTNAVSVKGLHQFTTEAWVFPTSLGSSGQGRYFYAENCSDNGSLGRNVFGVINNYAGCGPGVFGGFMRSAGDFSVILCAPTSFTINQWYHIAAVFNSDTNLHKLYVNGVLVDTDTYASPIMDANNPVSVPVMGNHPGSTGYNFPGIFDEVKIYNYERTPGQIVQDMNGGHPAPGSPVGSAGINWRFDEGYGNTIHDTGATGAYPGTMTFGSGHTNAEAWKTDCKLERCIRTWDNGGNDWGDIYFGNLSLFNSLTQMTLSFWVRPNTLTANRVLISKSNMPLAKNGGTQNSFTVSEDPSSISDVRVYISSSITDYSNYITTSNLGLTNNTWAHLVIVYDGTLDAASRVKVYKNGNLISNTITGTIPTSLVSSSTTNAVIGGSESPDHDGFIGNFDEFKLYTLPLTADQVKTEYNQGKTTVFGTVSTDSTGVASGSASRDYCVPGDSTTCNPPIGEWKFDENTGTAANDTSGNNRTGTLTAGPVWTMGKYGGSVKFDPSLSQYVNTADIDITDSFTLEAWVNPAAVAVSKTIISKGTGTATNYVLDLRNNDNSIGFFLYDSGGTARGLTAATTQKVPINQWSHVVGVYNSATTPNFTVYLNGQMITETANWTGTMNANDTNTVIGARGLGSSYTFNGSLDDVKIYNYARTPAQVAWDFNKGAPVAWYKLDECTGTLAHNAARSADDSVAGMDGTITPYTGRTAGTCGSAVSTEMWNGGTSGKYSGSLGFVGQYEFGDYVDAGNSSALQLTSMGTVAAWIKWSGTYSNPAIVCKSNWDTDRNGFCLAGYNDGIDGELANASNQLRIQSDNKNYRDNQWHHVVFTWDGTWMNLYVDGMPATAHVSQEFNPVSNVYNLTIGKDPSSVSHGFNGQIDDVRIYNYALTPVQIKTLYNAGSAVAF